MVAVVESRSVSEDREYGNDRRWRGMKSVRRKTVSSQICNRDFWRQAGHYGCDGREEERWVDYFRGLLRETIRRNSVLDGLRVR